MKTNDYLLMPLTWLQAAAQAAGLRVAPTATKADLARVLAAAGYSPAQVRQHAGQAPVIDPAALQGATAEAARAVAAAAAAESRAANAEQIAAGLQLETNQLRADAESVARAAAHAAAAAAAAGAVAARAEAAALAVRPAQVDATAVARAISDAVQERMRPLEAVLAQASPTVLADVAAAVAMPTERRSVLDVFGIDLRDRRGNMLMVDVWSDPDAPSVDPVYIWTDSTLRHFVAAQQTGENLWLAGPKGAGKTQACQQWAARTGRAFTRVNFTKFTTAEDFIGAVGLQNGATEFRAGDFLLAYRRPGAVILLDEVSNADPGNLAVLNGYLEPGARVNAGGSVWSRAAGVMVFAADNSRGDGDESGRYAGLRTMNSSFLDRFARMVAMDYLPPDLEGEAIRLHTGCSVKLAAHVVAFIGAARTKVTSGDIVDAPSLRQAVAFVRALEFMGIEEAWRTTVANKQPAESATALEAIRAACLNVSLIEGEL